MGGETRQGRSGMEVRGEWTAGEVGEGRESVGEVQ